MTEIFLHSVCIYVVVMASMSFANRYLAEKGKSYNMTQKHFLAFWIAVIPMAIEYEWKGVLAVVVIDYIMKGIKKKR